jgi:hypothetical protein
VGQELQPGAAPGLGNNAGLLPSAPVITGRRPNQPEGAGDPLAEAEAALQRLRANPDDKQAAEALEKALERLKQRKKLDGDTAKPQGR